MINAVYSWEISWLEIAILHTKKNDINTTNLRFYFYEFFGKVVKQKR